jgi:alpha-galactosidase
VTEGTHFITAEATRDLAQGMRITWILDLANQGPLFRLHVRLENLGQESQSVNWFPSWKANWDVNNEAQWVRWWQALRYARTEQSLTADQRIKLGSRLHSSDAHEDGVNPYWIVGGKNSRLYFALEWCGGWDAKLSGIDNGFSFSVRLPPEETQLTLDAGEAIEGPALFVTPTAEPDEMNNRYVWMIERKTLGKNLYGGPPTFFPLTYNHWYSAGFDVDASFLQRQVAAMQPYKFNAFIVDAGWYAKVGEWQPNTEKFQPGELEQLLQSVKAKGVRVGLWSCPQFVNANGDDLPLQVEDPPFFSRFVDAYLLDLSDNFETLLPDHVQALRQRYSIGWWKYDQAFFAEQSRAGAMKNVVAFQNALRAVRRANPFLTIENCQSGGRMINELTLLATQLSWLRDGEDNGLSHAQQNISVALGALEFVFPWAAYRWTNNLDQMDKNDDELTRLYCRSAMAGTWGISADLSKISERQQGVVIKEIQNYRRLNHIKKECWYELQLPDAGVDVAGVTYYDAERQKAGALLYRWDRNGAFDQQVKFGKLKSNSRYEVTDVDTGITVTARGKALMKRGVTVSFDARRQSALLFVEPVK